MSDTIDDMKAFQNHKRALKAKYGVNCPQCLIARPKAPPSKLMPQQQCKVDGYRDSRPHLTDEQYSLKAA